MNMILEFSHEVNYMSFFWSSFILSRITLTENLPAIAIAGRLQQVIGMYVISISLYTKLDCLFALALCCILYLSLTSY